MLRNSGTLHVANVFFFILIFSGMHACQADQRIPWNNSRLKGSPAAKKPLAVRRAYPNLQFQQPVELMPLPGTDRMLLLEVGGKVLTYEDREDCAKADLAIDLSHRIDQFRRAFAIAAHPKFEQNGEIFAVYAGGPVARSDGTRLSRFKMQLSPVPKIDPQSEEILLTWASGGHNGSAIRFDAQGYLYFSAGDGAKPYPPDEYDVGQDLSDLRSTICRIDVDRHSGPLGYSIPQDNPFVNLDGARPEIWAYGFRNPWRFSIDPVSQQLMCGDVGWELWELIFHVERGGNYGWSMFEGPQPIRNDIRPGPTPIRKPIVAYPHTEGLSVTGGFTYRGEKLPELKGSYLYGDYVTGLLWGLRFDGEQATWNEVLAETGMPIITFAESREHEVLVVGFNGKIHHLVHNDQPDHSAEFPRKLSETGLFTSTGSLNPSEGVYPYNVTATAYQDLGATSEFWVGVPGEQTIVSNKAKRNWKFPKDTVFAKTISMPIWIENQPQIRRIETQILHFDGLSWQPYCYAWNEAQDDAVLVVEAGGTKEMEVADRNGERKTLRWRHHSRSECRACHSNQTGGAVAFSYENLGRISFTSPRESEVQRMVDLGILDKTDPPGWKLRQMVNPHREDASLEQRARSYLASNCAHCHCRGGGGTVALDLSYFNLTQDIFAVDFPTTQGSFGLSDAKLIVPGAPNRSTLYYRMATSGTGHMPKLWKRDNDVQGLQLVHDWIASMEPTETPPSQFGSKPPESTATSAALHVFSQLLRNANDSNTGSIQTDAIAAFRQADAVTTGLFERFLPSDMRIKRLGNDIHAAGILTLRGDSLAGKQQFLNSKVLQCRNCHRLENQGQMVGPDFDGIGGKRTRAELLDSILHPSKKIEPQFANYTLVSADDQVIAGLKIAEDENSVSLRAANGETHRILREDIVHLTAQSRSLMPEGLAAEMTEADLINLLEFLSSLK